MEESLKESEEKYRTFVDTASDLMNITDKDGKFTDVNEAMTRTLGYTKEEMIGMHISQILTKESLENNFKPNWEKLRKEEKISIETTFVTKDGKEIYGELNAVVIHDSEGKNVGSSAVFHNLTERKKAEDEIKKKSEALEKANAKAVELVGELQTSYGKLEKKINELERYKKVTVNRELKMIKLKKRIEELEEG
jgi:PAS domain S-box-containing protein